MKWNWGTGIVIGMLAFMSFIMYLVITMSTNDKYSHDLVTEDYYAKEIAYQNEIDAQTNVTHFNESFKYEKTKGGLLIHFPKEIIQSDVKGNIYLYRPSNQVLDFNLPIALSGSKMLVPNDKMIDGRWNVTIDFGYQGKKYLSKKAIVY